MHRKGTEPILWVIIEAAVITLATIILFNYLNSVKEDRVFEKQFLARDTALLASTVGTVPGDVVFTYTHSQMPISDYWFKHEKGSAMVGKSKEDQSSDYPFCYDRSLSLEAGKIDGSNQIVYAKQGPRMQIAKESTLQFESICPNVETTGTITLIVVDPADTASWQTADYMRQKSSLPMTLTRDESSKTEEERAHTIGVDTPLVIGIETSDAVRVYYSVNNRQRSEKLACLVAKNLFEGVALIPTDRAIINKNTKGIGIMVTMPDTVAAERAATALNAAVRDYNG
jgi:hypothetical protein